MKRDHANFWWAPGLLALVAVSCLAVWVFAQQPSGSNPAAEPECVLLLRNGQTLQGRVSVADDRYQVFVPGGEIRVRPSEVLCVCRDLQDVYQRKRNIIRLDNVQDRLDLAEWCHQVGLLEEAAEELSQAMVLDPTHPLIPVIERRLKVAAAPWENADSPGKPPARGPSNYELDLMIRGMPPGTVETFTQVVQPMLMNSCAAAGCHGQASTNGFRLLRVPPGGLPSRRLTQRNLYAVLGWVDRNQPGKSPLLAVPVRSHGTARAPIFTDRHVAQYRQLVEWCYRVAQANEPITQVAHQEPADDGGRPSARGTRAAGAAPRGPAAARSPGKSPVVSAVGVEPAGVDPAAAKPTGKAGRKATTPQFTPSDPFDPEAFNRQFAPKNPEAPRSNEDPPLPPPLDR